MSLAAACGWSLARSAVVALAAWPLCKRECQWLHGLPRHTRSIAWYFVVLPFLCPELWTGYAYSGFALLAAGAGLWDHFPASPQWAHIRNAAVSELLLDLLLLLRAVPVGTLAAYFAPPPPLSPEAIHCLRLAARQDAAFARKEERERGKGGEAETRAGGKETMPSFPSSAWERVCSKLRFAMGLGAASAEGPSVQASEAELRPVRSQAELGNERQGFTPHAFSPSPSLPLSPTSSRAARRSRDWLRWKLALVRNASTAALPAIGLMFLVAFQEFELASLIGRPAWTVWLFDAQVGGLALVESLRSALFPVVCQLAVLVPVVASLVTARALPSPARAGAAPVSRSISIFFWSFSGLGILVTVAVPFLLVGRGTLPGLLALFRNPSQWQTLLREVLIGTGYSTAAAIVGTLLAALFLHLGRRSPVGRAASVAGALPGLFGSLILGLALIRLLQQPYLHLLYKTPLSLTFGLVLFLLPRALLLRLAVWSTRPRTGLHLAGLLRDSPSSRARDQARELAWQMRGRVEFWSLALLAYWGFLDLTIAYLLAPVTIVSTPVMLYNQMHFGKNAALSARVLVAVLLPALCFCLVCAARRPLSRWLWR